jgi:hypothetical protein
LLLSDSQIESAMSWFLSDDWRTAKEEYLTLINFF